MGWQDWLCGIPTGLMLGLGIWAWYSIKSFVAPPVPPTEASEEALLYDPSGIYWLSTEDYQTSWWFDVDGTGNFTSGEGQHSYFLWRPESRGCVSIRFTHRTDPDSDDWPPSPSKLVWNETIDTNYFRFDIYREDDDLRLKDLRTGQIFEAD